VAKVDPDSPAKKAGMDAGDVVVAFDGQPVQGSTDLRNRIGLAPIGTEVTLTLRRGQDERRVPVTITEAR
jgi:serine protease DegQ